VNDPAEPAGKLHISLTKKQKIISLQVYCIELMRIKKEKRKNIETAEQLIKHQKPVLAWQTMMTTK